MTFFFFLMYLKSGSRYFCFNSHFVGWIVTVDASRLQTKIDLLFIYLFLYTAEKHIHLVVHFIKRMNDVCFSIKNE